MKRFWNWLFPQPERSTAPTFLPHIRSVLEERRPDLMDEFNALGPKSASHLGLFLDKHFPRADTRWGLTSFTQAHVNLRRYLENANVGR